ncbi:MAG: HD domain-containing protein [Candidatus Micrarchaeota archaeon]|nr:HD domain-containing protein [Candidatus Micrarchaeota archaeon]
MNDAEATDIVKYFYELGQLRFVKRAGWWVAKVRDPENVAQHSFRAAAIAYVLARLENHPEPEKIALKALFHDVHEVRLMDRHKISSNYLKTPREVTERVEREQCSRIPAGIGGDIFRLLNENDPVANAIAKDADYLDIILAAREYCDVGYKDAWDWIERASSDRVLKTKSARTLAAKIKKTDSGSWWRGLKEKVR